MTFTATENKAITAVAQASKTAIATAKAIKSVSYITVGAGMTTRKSWEKYDCTQRSINGGKMAIEGTLRTYIAVMFIILMIQEQVIPAAVEVYSDRDEHMVTVIALAAIAAGWVAGEWDLLTTVVDEAAATVKPALTKCDELIQTHLMGE